MNTFTILQDYPVLFITLVACVGLIVGSFLNVVIYRLPVMMERNWRKECTEFLQPDNPQDQSEQEPPFNLSIPRSRCPHCGTVIRFYQNIPVISYLWLNGRCAHCQAAISIRYPIVETLTGLASAIVAWQFGFTLETLFALLLTWSLITLSGIDIDHHLLPDSITLPILWLGLILSLFELFTDSQTSIIGAAVGYLSLWTVYQVFKLLTGKEGMGFGDFKLLALFGAWLGWQYLPQIILLSSLVGAIVGTMMILLIKRDRNIPIPFGPYLAIAGWISLLWGNQINQIYLDYAGL